MNYLTKIDIVEVYTSTYFKECVMYCTDSGIISKGYEKKVMWQYNLNEELENEVVCNFFDYIGINEDEFLTISNKINQNIKENLEFYDSGDGVSYEIWKDVTTEKFYTIPIEIVRDFNNLEDREKVYNNMKEL